MRAIHCIIGISISLSAFSAAAGGILTVYTRQQYGLVNSTFASPEAWKENYNSQWPKNCGLWGDYHPYYVLESVVPQAYDTDWGIQLGWDFSGRTHTCPPGSSEDPGPLNIRAESAARARFCPAERFPILQSGAIRLPDSRAPAGQKWVCEIKIQVPDKRSDLECPKENPIYSSIGAKAESVYPYVDPRGTLSLNFVYASENIYGSGFRVGGVDRTLMRGYRTQTDGEMACINGDQPDSQLSAMPPAERDKMGPRCFPIVALASIDDSVADDTSVRSIDEYGNVESFNPPFDQGFVLGSLGTGQLRRVGTGSTGMWLLKRVKEGVMDVFDDSLVLVKKVWADGRSVSVSRLPPVPDSPAYIRRSRVLADLFGRSVQYTYDSVGRVTEFAEPDGSKIGIIYTDTGKTATLVYPDGSSPKYIFGELSKTASTYQPNLLTSKIDELGKTVGSYTYSSSGEALTTIGAGGVNAFSITDSFIDHGRKTLTETGSLGEQYQETFSPIGDTWVRTGGTQPAGAGCPAAQQSTTYDTFLNPTEGIDFNGTKSCLAFDVGRRLRTVHVTGLVGTSACSGVIPANAALPLGSRKVTTAWHPDWNVAARTAEPGLIETRVYNGQPDPFNGNAVASCAPSNALLPDGKPIAVVCKQVQQRTTDADGHLGFGATLEAGAVNRVVTFTYDQYGQVLTTRGPRTSVDDTTTYAYYTDTTADHMLGDLKTVTNAFGKVTTFNKYNKHGQVLQSTDPNGTITVNTYDQRQRVLSITFGGEATTFAYDIAGQLVRVLLPDSSWLGYEYDDAHRQIAAKDNLGNRIEYQLDNAGHRISESVKDPSGGLKRKLDRVMDALGRAQQHTGKEWTQ